VWNRQRFGASRPRAVLCRRVRKADVEAGARHHGIRLVAYSQNATWWPRRRCMQYCRAEGTRRSASYAASRSRKTPLLLATLGKGLHWAKRTDSQTRNRCVPLV